MNMAEKLPKKRGYFILQEINPVIRFITMADFLMVSGFGMMMPIFAVFVIKNIEGGSVEVVGIAMTIYLLIKSLGQIPAGLIIDRIKGERDDFWAVFAGYAFYCALPLFYIFVHTPAQLYLMQVFYGIGSAIAFPAWYAIFTRHIDRDKEGIEWGMYNTMVDLGGGVAAGMGGFIAARFGFEYLFVLVSVIMTSALLLFLFVYRYMRPGTIFRAGEAADDRSREGGKNGK